MAIPSSSMPRTSQLVAQQRLQTLRQRTVTRWAARAAPTEDEVEELEARDRKRRFLQVILWGLIVVLVAAVPVTVILKALPQEGGLGWLVAIKDLPVGEIGEISSVLAPFLAIAVTIERLLETGFDWYEQWVQGVAELVSEVRKPIDWVETELLNAYQAIEEIAGELGGRPDEESLRLFSAAEERLARAEARLLNWVNAPEYVAMKRAISIFVGLFVGLEVAILGDLGMFNAIGVPVPRILDMLVTGLVVGAGPGPMHSLIGILQGGKNALDKLGSLAEGKTVQAAVSEITNAIERTGTQQGGAGGGQDD